MKGKYLYCENGPIPSEEVVKKFSEPIKTAKTDEADECMTPQEAMYEELEAIYAVKKDWTAAYAAMNID